MNNGVVNSYILSDLTGLLIKLPFEEFLLF